MSTSSVQTNSQLPVACTEVELNNNSASVDGSRSHNVDISSASCSPYQSGHGRVVPRDETVVKSACESNAAGISLSLHSDVGSSAAAAVRIRSSEPQMPCYVSSSTVGDGVDIVNLRSDFSAGTTDSRNVVSGSRLSRDGVLGPMTDVDATPEQNQTSAQPG